MSVRVHAYTCTQWLILNSCTFDVWCEKMLRQGKQRAPHVFFILLNHLMSSVDHNCFTVMVNLLC